MKQLSLVIFVFLMTHLTTLAQVNQQQVIPGELPDPSVIEVNGVYYACGSSNDWGPVYPIYTSTDLEHWTFVNYVFQTPPSWTSSSFWAPEIYYHDGLFYCYYTAKRKDGVSCIGVATTTDIRKGFKDQGALLEWGDEAIDAFVYNEDGTLYITWKAYGLTPDKPITILGSALSEDGLSLKGESFTVLTAEENSWEKGGMEGQCIVQHEGYLYMLYSGNACCGVSCDYQVGVARAKTMQGPWEKFEGNPILVSNESWKCPGHGTVVSTGGKWYYLYHAYHQDGFPYLGRSALLSEMRWNAESGWPSFGIKEQQVDPTMMKEDIADQFETGKLEPWWHVDIPSYSLETAIRKNQLTITEKERPKENQTGSALVVVPQGPDFTMTTQLAEKNHVLKGLVFYATNTNSVGLGVKDNELILWKVVNNQYEEIHQETLKNASDIFLRANVKEAHLLSFQYSLDGKNWQNIESQQPEETAVSGDHLAWWSWGMKCGLFIKPANDGKQNSGTFEQFSLQYE